MMSAFIFLFNRDSNETNDVYTGRRGRRTKSSLKLKKKLLRKNLILFDFPTKILLKSTVTVILWTINIGLSWAWSYMKDKRYANKSRLAVGYVQLDF